MKICIVTGTFHPELSGPARYLNGLARELTARGHAITVVTSCPSGQTGDYPFRVIRIPLTIPWPRRLPKMGCAVLREARHADLVYVNDHGLSATLANLLLRKPALMRVGGDWAWERARRQRLVDETIDEFQTRRHPPRVEVLRKVQRFGVRRAHRVLTPSEHLRGIVAGWGVDRESIRVVHNAVRPETYRIPSTREAARREIGEDEGRLIVTVGRLIALKGIDRVIGALAGLEADVRLLVVGDGPDRGLFERTAKEKGVASRVVFVGQVPHEKVAVYLKAADALALATDGEGLSHVLLEALMVGLPAVTTRVGGNPEIVRDGVEGLLFRPGDDEALRELLRRLLSDRDLRERMSAAALERLRDFSWDRLVRETLEVMEETVRME